MKYASAVKKILTEELENPSEAFVRFFASQIYDGRITQSVLEQFTEIVRDARAQFVNERVDERLKSALTANAPRALENIEPDDSEEERESGPSDKEGLETTADEMEGFNIVRAIAREAVPVSRIAMRDTKTYFGVLLDDNNRKPICRLWFNRKQWYLGLFEGKAEERVAISSVDEIFTYANRIKATILEYESAAENTV